MKGVNEKLHFIRLQTMDCKRSIAWPNLSYSTIPSFGCLKISKAVQPEIPDGRENKLITISWTSNEMNMKGTTNFKATIQAYLEERARTDELFAISYAKEHKDIDNCITYILNEVKRSGCNGFNDDEIYSMAMHYYDEDNIVVGSKINCNVVVNHVVELTDEEKAEARQAAILRYQQEQIESRKRPKKTKQVIQTISQPTLFD